MLDLPATRIYLARCGAEPRSLKSAVVREEQGQYWRDVAVITFTKAGAVSVTMEQYEPTEQEAADIAEEFSNVEWPELQLLSRIIDPPKMIAEAEPSAVFEFRNRENLITMVQVRIEIMENGQPNKKYIPWTYWDDGEWRICEPDGPLPLFNINKLKDNTTVFLHEGAKAAKHVQWMVDGETAEARAALLEHPWGQELTGAVHLGWIGGAMSPYRTDWTILIKNGVKRVYIVADNDAEGRSAVPSIARYIRIPTFVIQFTDEFEKSFDLADSFPDKMFGSIDAGKHYIGPSFRECLHPATWATDLIPNAQGRPTAVLRDSFKNMWAYIEEADLFVCTEMPDILRPEKILNNMLASFSHVKETSRLITKTYRGRSARVCYRPDHPGLVVTYQGSSAINLHTPSTIRAREGSPQPWEDFLSYMFVNENELAEVRRWLATLIAQPAIRMSYGLLLISERQGIGKTTLGSHILAPLVGIQNVSFPGEQEIISSFNEWVANKRLVIVNEIYSGSSWKAYHALKSVITDRDVTVNQKFMRQYKIENWCHILACSNSMRAMKMEHDDRRWFYPEVAEVPWPAAKFVEFRQWIENGGLGIIKAWAQAFNNYVQPAERAPMTERKKEMIDGSRSEAQREAAALAEMMKERAAPVALSMKDVVAWVRNSTQGKVFDTDYELRKVMIDAGAYCWPKRIKINGQLQYLIMNEQLRDAAMRTADEELGGILRGAVVNPRDILPEAM